jgi:hypothetical protein
MNEADWLAGTDAGPLLTHLGKEARARKLRLFVCACGRRLWHLLSSEWSRQAIIVGERLADGEVEEPRAIKAAERARSAILSAIQARGRRGTAGASSAAWVAASAPSIDLNGTRACEVVLAAQRAFEEAAGPRLNRLPPIGRRALRRAGRQNWAGLVREVFGNPFRVAVLDPSWRTPTVLSLAERAYEKRDGLAVRILGDALDDAGCDDEALLAHCRADCDHVRGCWAVDRVLAKA